MSHIQNPRRSPRAPARCRIVLAFADGSRLEATTEDVSAMGCQVILPRAVAVDTPVSIELTSPALREPLAVQAHLAWASDAAPFRAGISYEKSGHRAAARWFEQLVKASPGLAPRRRVPDQIAADATIYLGAPPRHVVDFTAEEVEVLRHVAGGATAGSLRTSFRDRWPTAQYALFSLLERHAVTLERGKAAHPDTWRTILQQAEATLALEALGSPVAAAVALGGARPTPPPPPSPARPAAATAPRAPYRMRTPGAQALYEKALKDLEEGRFAPAKAALEQALALSPGDPDLARALGQAMSRQRATKP